MTKKLLGCALTAALFCAGAPHAFAVEDDPCSDEKLRAVDALAGLPPALATLLGAGRSGVEGIADRGGEFSRTDALTRPMPMRRFDFAGVADGCAWVAVEQGGIGYSLQLRTYRLEDKGWRLVERRVGVRGIPNNLQELLALRTQLQVIAAQPASEPVRP